MPVLKFLSDTWAVSGNEFRVFRRNRTAILISLVVLPLFFTVSLGAGSGGAGTHFSRTALIPIAFIDNDLTTDSSRFLQRLESSGEFDELRLGYREENALAAIGTGKIYAAIIVPKGFRQELATSQTSTIILYADDGEAGVAEQILTTLNSVVQDFNPKVEVRTEKTSGFSQVEIIQKGALFSGFNIGLVIVLGVVQIFATFFEIAGGMSREREEGTLARLLVGPTGFGAIMFGKTLFDSILATLRTLIVLAMSVYLYGARPNTDLGTLLAASLLIALVTMGFGFVVSALRVGTRAVVIVEFFLVLFLFAFSGLVIDRELLRGFSKIVSSLLPWAYGFEVLRRTILIGRPLLSLTIDLQFIGLATILFYTISYLLFRFFRERMAF